MPREAAQAQLVLRFDDFLKKPWCSAMFCMCLGMWFYSWLKLLSFCYYIFVIGDDDILNVAPLSGQLVGLAMTNILGFIHFTGAKDRLGARLATVDLDIWLLALRHGPAILRGEAPKPWEKLRLRNSIWRGIPLACIDFYLASRNSFEMPFCQFGATLRAVTFNWDASNLHTPWLSSLADHGIHPNDISAIQSDFKYVQNQFSINPSANPPVLDYLVKSKLVEIERSVWKSCHCNNSKWDLGKMTWLGDLSQTWLSGFAAEPNDDFAGTLAVKNFYDMSRYCSLFALNIRLQQEIEMRLLQHPRVLLNLRSVLLRCNSTLLKTAAFGSALMRDKQLIHDGKMLITKHVKSTPELVATVSQSRRTWKLIMARFSLFNAALPIAAVVCQARRIRARNPQACVRIHVMLDAFVLVTCMILALQAGLATCMGQAIDTVFELILQELPVVMKQVNLITFGEHNDVIFRAVAKLFQRRVPNMAKKIKESLESSATISTEMSLQICAAVVLVLVLSFLLAKALRPDSETLPNGKCLNSAVCGPLYLLTSVKDTGVEEMCPYIVKQIFLRGLLLCLFVAVAWRNVTPTHAEMWYAAVFEETATYTWMCCSNQQQLEEWPDPDGVALDILSARPSEEPSRADYQTFRAEIAPSRRL